MGHLTAIVEPDGRFMLPREVQRTLGIVPGSTIDLTLEAEGVWISRQSRPKLSPDEVKAILKDMQDLFAGADYSLEDDLMQMRKEEEEHSLRKYGC